MFYDAALLLDPMSFALLVTSSTTSCLGTIFIDFATIYEPRDPFFECWESFDKTCLWLLAMF